MSDALKNAMLCLVERRKYIVTLGELDCRKTVRERPCTDWGLRHLSEFRTKSIFSVNRDYFACRCK